MINYSADDIVDRFRLEPHPEGGFFKKFYRDQAIDDGQGAVTWIYFLLWEGEVSTWHWVNAVEMWHYYTGAPLALSASAEGSQAGEHILGVNFGNG